MKNLSDVTGVIHNDHALYGEQYLHDHDYSDTWQVVVANDKMLMLDYDAKQYDGSLSEQFHSTLGIFDQVVGSNTYKGYSIKNCVVCCTVCILTRGNRFTYEQFLEIGKLLSELRTH